MSKPRIVVLISGGGTNLQAIINACAGNNIDAGAGNTLRAEVVCVVSNRRKAFGLQRAEKSGIETVYAPLKPALKRGLSRTGYDLDLAGTVASYKPNLVVLAGWMHVLSAGFIDAFAGRLINLHPALPGEIAGTNAIERAFTAFERGERQASGVMVHHVIPEVDAGEAIAVRRVPFIVGDTLETFAERMHAAEHVLIVEAIASCLQHEPV